MRRVALAMSEELNTFLMADVCVQLGGNGLQQGASLGIAQGMLADSVNRTLAL